MPFVRTSLKSLIPKLYDFEPQTFGEHLLKRRLFLSLTQAEVADLFGVSLFTICNWEKGYNEPKISQIPLIIKFLGYDPSKTIPSSITEHLLFKRRELGWTQKIAARSFGVDPCTWSSWEGGGMIMTHKHRYLVASFLGVAEEKIIEKMRKQRNERHRK